MAYNEEGLILEKKKRIVNKELCESYRDMACAICFIRGGGRVVGHHIKTKGSGGHDHSKNLIPVCNIHHREFHDKGLRWVIDNHKSAREYLNWIGFDITDEDITFPEIKINNSSE